MWTYKEKVIDSIEDMPADAVGFVYVVTHIPTDKKYVGKKILKHRRIRPPLKGKKRRRIDFVESDWKTYYGSSDDVKTLLKETTTDDFRREILYFAENKKKLSYLETRELFHRNVLENQDEYFNRNIQGKWFPKDTK